MQDSILSAHQDNGPGTKRRLGAHNRGPVGSVKGDVYCCIRSLDPCFTNVLPGQGTMQVVSIGMLADGERIPAWPRPFPHLLDQDIGMYSNYQIFLYTSQSLEPGISHLSRDVCLADEMPCQNSPYIQQWGPRAEVIYFG